MRSVLTPEQQADHGGSRRSRLREVRMGQPDTTSATSPIPAHGPVVFPAPPGGWSREAYRDAIQAFTDARGRVPRTVTMHPHTLAAVTSMVVRREVEKVVDELVAVVHREEQL